MIDVAEVNALHLRAMELASKAFQAELHGDYGTAEAFFRQAFGLEKRAAEAVAGDVSLEPSRSVLLRSAASLALDCREFREAERLVALALSGTPPYELCEELRDLLEKVYFSRHLDLRGMELDPIEFQMAMVGGAVGFGVMESRQFLRRAETLERLVYRTAERKRRIPFRESGAPTRDTTSAYEVYFSTSRAASYAITVRIGRPKRQLSLEFAEQPTAPAIVDEVLVCLDDFSNGRVEQLRERIPDEPYFNNFTALAKKLSPDGSRVQTVGFTALRGEEKRVVALVGPPSDIWRPKVEGGTTLEYVGRIHAADETSKTRNHPVFRVEDEAGNVSPGIRVRPGILQDIVKPYWGDLVIVIASKPKRGAPIMVDIRPVAEPTPDQPQ